MSRLGAMIAESRKGKGWSEFDLVGASSYRNIQKGLRRLRAMESGQDLLPAAHRYEPFVKALGLAEEQVLLAMADDFAELDDPVPPRVIIRWLPAFYGQMKLPECCLVEEAIRMAAEFSKLRGYRTCVVLSRLRALYLEPDGSRCQICSLPASNFPLSAEFVDKVELSLRRRLGRTTIEPPTGTEERA